MAINLKKKADRALRIKGALTNANHFRAARDTIFVHRRKRGAFHRREPKHSRPPVTKYHRTERVEDI